MEKSKAIFTVLDYFVQTHFDRERVFGMIAKIETTQNITFSMEEIEMFSDLMEKIIFVKK